MDSTYYVFVQGQKETSSGILDALKMLKEGIG